MSKKKALPDEVGDFFEGESVFFPPSQPAQPTASPQHQNRQLANAEPVSLIPATKQAHTAHSKPMVKPVVKQEPPRNQEKVVSDSHRVAPTHNHDTMPPLVVEAIRKVVKRIGKEAATYRFTQEEKQRLGDIVYTYNRQGYRTSENEITRIAVNWLLWDYQEQGEQSVLARLLRALHE